MKELTVKVVVGITSPGSDLAAYELIVRMSGRKELVSPRQRVAPENWGEFLIKASNWLDHQNLVSAQGNLAGYELRFLFSNGGGVLAPIPSGQFEVLKGAIEDNLRSRLLEGRTT